MRLFIAITVLILSGSAALLLVPPDRSSAPSSPIPLAPPAPVESGGSDEVEPAPRSEPGPIAVRGQVVDTAGRPLSGVAILAASPPLDPRRESTSIEGRFTLDLPQGTWQVAASREGYGGWERELRVGRSALELRVVLDAQGSLTGRVDAGRGDATPYRVILEDETPSETQAACEGSGDYRFDSLAPGEYRAHVATPTRRWDDVGRVTIRAGERATLDLQVPAIGLLEILALLPPSLAGAPQPAQIELLELSSGVSTRHDVVISTEGRAQLSGLPPGAYQLRVLAWDRLASRRANLEIRGDDVTSVTVRWEEGRIEGRVLDEQGRAAPSVVRVQPLREGRRGAVPDSAEQLELETGPEGHYLVEGLAPGSYLVSARGEGYAWGEVELEQSATSRLDLHFAGAAQIEVQVLDQGEPLPGATVFAIRRPLSDWAGRADTDVRGLARLSDLPPGDYRIVARMLASTDATESAADLRVGGAETRLQAGEAQVLTLNLGGP